MIETCDILQTGMTGLKSKGRSGFVQAWKWVSISRFGKFLKSLFGLAIQNPETWCFGFFVCLFVCLFVFTLT